MRLDRRTALLSGVGALASSLARRVHAQPAPAVGADGRFAPARTWVFSVGILSWSDRAAYHSFPTAGRKDAELVRLFARRGVPSDHIVFLSDAAATRGAILSRLEALLARTAPGDLLWFYYAGHGVLDENAGMHLVPYDTRSTELVQTGLALRDVLATLERRFRGYAVLTADCCHSGAMVTETAPRTGPVTYAAVTSSLSSEESTGNWTFTECLLDALSGRGQVDVDRDGLVQFGDLAQYAERRMAFEEEQLSSAGASAAFPSLVLAQATPLRDPRIGTFVEVRWENQWFKARVLDVRADGQQRIHYAGYPASDDEWVTPDRVRAVTVREMPVGTAVDAEWHGRWWPAQVTATRLGLHRIHYDGFTDVWDEWVSSRRVRPRGAAPTQPTRRTLRRS